jgi:hypothetical protein
VDKVLGTHNATLRAVLNHAIRAGLITAKPVRWPELPRPLGPGIVTDRCGLIALLAR